MTPAYDGRGNQISESRSGRPIYSYVYDATNHMVLGANLGSGEMSRYTYNALDMRIRNTQTILPTNRGSTVATTSTATSARRFTESFTVEPSVPEDITPITEESVPSTEVVIPAIEESLPSTEAPVPTIENLIKSTAERIIKTTGLETKEINYVSSNQEAGDDYSDISVEIEFV